MYMKNNNKYTYTSILIFLLFILSSSSPFKETKLAKNAKISQWWSEVIKTKYYNVDFATFTFKDISQLKGNDKSTATQLLKSGGNETKKEIFVAVFDNRNNFCGLLGANYIIAKGGTLRGKEVYLNMFLNTIHLPSAHYIVDNIDYYTDNLGRIERVYCGDLQLKKRGRNNKSQRYSVAFKDGIKGDNCGHLIPQALNGPAEQINYVPQNRNLNSGDILTLEKKAISAKQQGYKVSYEIRIKYNNKDKRPYGFENNVIVYKSDGSIKNNYTGTFLNK